MVAASTGGSRPDNSSQGTRPPAPEPSAVSLYRHWNDAAGRRKAPRGAGDRRVTGKTAKDGCPKPAEAVPFVARSVPAMVAGMRRHEWEEQHSDGRCNSNRSMHDLPRIPRNPRIPEALECVRAGSVPRAGRSLEIMVKTLRRPVFSTLPIRPPSRHQEHNIPMQRYITSSTRHRICPR
jgi:hypothetical protein